VKNIIKNSRLIDLNPSLFIFNHLKYQICESLQGSPRIISSKWKNEKNVNVQTYLVLLYRTKLFFFLGGGGYLLILVCLKIHKNAVNTLFVANSRIEYLSVYFCFLLSEPQQIYPFVGIPAGISFCRNPSRDILLSEPQQGYPFVGTPAGISFCRNRSIGYPVVGTPAGISFCWNPSRDILLSESQQEYSERNQRIKVA